MSGTEDCEFCGHASHDGIYCDGVSRCDCGRSHPCACSYPDPDNYSELP